MAQGVVRIYLVLLIMTVLVQRNAADVGAFQCRYSNFELGEITISDCDDAPCNLQVGETYTVDFYYWATQDAYYLQLVTFYFEDYENGQYPYMSAESHNYEVYDSQGNEASRPYPARKQYNLVYEYTVPETAFEKATVLMVQLFSNDLSSMEKCFGVKVKVTK